MISKSDISLFRKLSKSSFRRDTKLFIAEGHKCISDLLDGFVCKLLIVDEQNHNIIKSNISNKNISNTIERIEIVDNRFDFSKISNLKTPTKAIAIFEQKNYNILDFYRFDLSIFLDDIQDPGNMGTIIRTADWFAIDSIFVSRNSVDIYSPKVVQATMGSLARVPIIEVEDIDNFFNQLDADIYGTFLDSENIYERKKNNRPSLIVMGNEGNGISDKVSKYINKRITIPNFSTKKEKAESLNVAIATAIVISEFRR